MSVPKISSLKRMAHSLDESPVERPVKIVQMSHVSADTHGKASAVYEDHSLSNSFFDGVHFHHRKFHAGISGLL